MKKTATAEAEPKPKAPRKIKDAPVVVIETPKPEFKSLYEVAADPLFKVKLKSLLYGFESKRRLRRAPELSSRYKRDFYDTFSEKGQFNSGYFTEQIVLIWQKKSALPRSLREAIKSFGEAAVLETIKEYNLK